MDGKGAWRDNVFVERLCRSIKYEEVYLRAYANIPKGRASIAQYIDGFYNATRSHSSLDRQTPNYAYFGRAAAIIKQRGRIKRQTIQHRRLQHRKIAA